MVDVPSIKNLFPTSMIVCICALCCRDKVPRRMPKEQLPLARIHCFAFDLNCRFTRLLQILVALRFRCELYQFVISIFVGG